MLQMRATILICLFASIAFVTVPLFSPHAQDKLKLSEQRPTQLSGLLVSQAKRTTVEGKDGIEITFDKPSGERLRRFTNDAVGRRIVFFINQRKLATLRLLDPITKGGVLLTGEMDSIAIEAVFSAGAVIYLELE